MNELVTIKKNDIFTDSLIIAGETGFEHSIIQRKVRDFETEFKEFGKIRFTVLKTENSNGGRPKKIYELNEPQASYMITLLDNTDKVRNFKLRLIKEFYRMRKFIIEKQSAEWQQSRLIGKQIRREETDAILDKLIPLAEFQGSQNPDKLYMVYSKLVNSTLGIVGDCREELPTAYIDAIRFLENAISNIMLIEVDRETHYKEIYQICKAKCQIIKELAFLPSLRLLGGVI